MNVLVAASPHDVLSSVVVHQGVTGMVGHYYACCRNGAGWWKCDDDDGAPTLISADAALSEQAYMLFYDSM